MKPTLQTIGLLCISNTFMTIAWYGHLKQRNSPILWAILLSWGIAFFEYLFQVPANRIGASRFSLTQLKVMQECVTLVVFLIYAFIAYKETPKWNTIAAMLLIVGAVYLTFMGGGKSMTAADESATSPDAASLPAVASHPPNGASIER